MVNAFRPIAAIAEAGYRVGLGLEPYPIVSHTGRVTRKGQSIKTLTKPPRFAQRRLADILQTRERERERRGKMVSKRQKEAKKRFNDANPQLFSDPKPEHSSTSTSKKKKEKKKKGEAAFKKGKKTGGAATRKHPLRVPGMRPGESCFICKATDHIAKLCPEKAMWEKKKVMFCFLIILPPFCVFRYFHRGDFGIAFFSWYVVFLFVDFGTWNWRYDL